VVSASNYDIITVGVFTAGPQKYKHGGLRRLLQLYDSYSVPTATNSFSDVSHETDRAGTYDFVTTVTEALSKLVDLHETANSACDSVCSAALLGDTPALMTSKAQLTEQVYVTSLLSL
jgi:hypothetical protein